MIFSLDGCAVPDSLQCKASKARIKSLLEDLFAARFRPPLFFKSPIGPRPSFEDILRGEPEPEVSIPDFFEQQNALNGELLSSALRQSTPTPAMKELRDSGLVIEAATEVLTQLRSAASALEEEIEGLKQSQCK